MSRVTRSGYHHGDLRQALVGTGLELARTGGPAAVVLREAARRLQVSPTAAYRHFADRQELFLAVRREAVGMLGRRMAEGADPADPLGRFRRLGAGYVEFALEEPGLFRTVAAPGAPLDAVTPADPDPFQLLAEGLDALVAAGLMAPERRPRADAAAWSAVHGLSVLLLDGQLPREDAPGLADAVLHTVAFGLLPGDGPRTPPG